MGLPNWTDEGLLPQGIHSAAMPDVYERFVCDAPHREHREMLYGALATYLRLLRRLVSSGRAWINGGFCTQKATEPHDVDVVLHPADWAALEALDERDQTDLLGLLTHQDIIVGSMNPPQWWARLQPVGGALDAFLCYPGQEDMWYRTWSSVKGPDDRIVPGAVKGFVEVSW
ncbi:MAG: DUF6932 family protein [Pseudonocardiaceae bacterium]